MVLGPSHLGAMSRSVGVGTTSVTRLGDFVNFLVTHFLTKVAQIF